MVWLRPKLALLAHPMQKNYAPGGGALFVVMLFTQYAPSAILKPKNRKTI
jgi:hypothetical protein